MQFIPVSTRVLIPPQDDFQAALLESLPVLQERDIVLISSKVVAIGEGRCVPLEENAKTDLVTQAADIIIPRQHYKTPLTVTNHTFLGSSGLDESNGNGFLVLLPRDSFASAEAIHALLCSTYGIQELGVLITDSRSLPFRYGATGVALGWWGIEPIEDLRGRTDLFGRAIQYERSNLVDGLAAAATVLAGEVDERIPVVIARGVPRVTFVQGNTRDQLFVPYQDDTFRVLYERFIE